MGNFCCHSNDGPSILTTTHESPHISMGERVKPDLKVFTYADLKAATRDFRQDSVVGEGGFGRVFKGYIDEKTFAPSKPGVGMAVAVKKSDQDNFHGLQQWLAEVKFLGQFSHPNLVKLLGYCRDEDQLFLVYEYMPKGSLDRHIFGKGVPEPPSWGTRLKIVIGAARGLAFLHSKENSVIYRDFKASNILLDRDYNAKLSDFGLVKLGPINGYSHVTTRVVGTYGYAAPEYIASGHLYVKSDVYGFGVVLLELLTGLVALDPNRPASQLSLVIWTKPMLSKKGTLKKIIDPRLGNECPLKAALKMAELILKCLVEDPRKRPSMQEVLDDLLLIDGIKD